MCCNQNCHEKVFNRELYICAGGLDILKMIIPLIYSVSYFNLGGLGALFAGTRPIKALPWRQDWLQPRSWHCVECAIHHE